MCCDLAGCGSPRVQGGVVVRDGQPRPRVQGQFMPLTPVNISGRPKEIRFDRLQAEKPEHRVHGLLAVRPQRRIPDDQQAVLEHLAIEEEPAVVAAERQHLMQVILDVGGLPDRNFVGKSEEVLGRHLGEGWELVHELEVIEVRDGSLDRVTDNQDELALRQ